MKKTESPVRENSACVQLAAAIVLIALAVVSVRDASGQALEVLNSTNQVLMHVQEGGNVGIGTTNPIGILNIRQDLDGSVLSYIENIFDGSNVQVGYRIREGAGGAESGLVKYGNTHTAYPNGLLLFTTKSGSDIHFQSGGGNRMIFTATGRLGIGTTTPGSELDVDGTVNATGFQGDGSALASLNASNLSTGTVSDARLSANVALKNVASTFTAAQTFANGLHAATLDVNGDISVAGLVDGVDVATLKSDFDDRVSSYAQFGNLNNASVTVANTPTKLSTGTHTFTKLNAGSKVEITVNSRFGVGDIIDSYGVIFEVRIDDAVVPLGNKASILQSNSTDFMSIHAVAENVAAGQHTVSIWAYAPTRTGATAGSATNVVVDPGGWGGTIAVKESW